MITEVTYSEVTALISEFVGDRITHSFHDSEGTVFARVTTAEGKSYWKSEVGEEIIYLKEGDGRIPLIDERIEFSLIPFIPVEHIVETVAEVECEPVKEKVKKVAAKAKKKK